MEKEIIQKQLEKHLVDGVNVTQIRVTKYTKLRGIVKAQMMIVLPSKAKKNVKCTFQFEGDTLRFKQFDEPVFPFLVEQIGKELG
jgi:hypothetical protein